MDAMDGTLLVPPERAPILGRDAWKGRHVVVGRRMIGLPAKESHQSVPSYSHLIMSSRSNSASGKQFPKLSVSEEPFISVYKSKDDGEPIQSWPLTAVTDCQVQLVARRKQSHTLPTLVITLNDRERKRRSSRAGGLISTGKESGDTALWFRTTLSSDEGSPSLQDWANFIMNRKAQGCSPSSSPVTPGSSHTFSPRPREGSDYFPKPAGVALDRSLHHKSSIATHSTGGKDRPLNLSSTSPSLRSKRSDVSSIMPIQQMNFPIPGQLYTTVLPTDLPSPTTATAPEYSGTFIEGWTSAQGRSSVMAPPTDTRTSIIPQRPASKTVSGKTYHETILDRAFQLRCIPGSEKEVPGEEKLSSLARFDALMREADEKRKAREPAVQKERTPARSTFDADESSASETEQDLDDTDTDDDDFSPEEDDKPTPELIPLKAQRALHFIAYSPTTSPRPSISRNPISFHADATHNLTHAPPTRPHTAHSKTRAHLTQRAQSTHIVPSTMSFVPEESATTTNAKPLRRPSVIPTDSSNKRLSFTEFTKKLSSTSNLLLVQTNTSNSNRTSTITISDADAVSPTSIVPRSSLKPGPCGLTSEQEKRCSWRGVAGVEGGFF